MSDTIHLGLFSNEENLCQKLKDGDLSFEFTEWGAANNRSHTIENLTSCEVSRDYDQDRYYKVEFSDELLNKMAKSASMGNLHRCYLRIK